MSHVNNEEDVESDEWLVVERLVDLALPVVVQPHPAVGHHAHKHAERGADQVHKVTEEGDGYGSAR
jgi:hypothetical protein